MKRFLLMCATVLTVFQSFAGESIRLKDLTNGTFAPKYISGVNPLKGTSKYQKTTKKSLNTRSKQGSKRVLSSILRKRKVNN